MVHNFLIDILSRDWCHSVTGRVHRALHSLAGQWLRPGWVPGVARRHGPPSSCRSSSRAWTPSRRPPPAPGRWPSPAPSRPSRLTPGWVAVPGGVPFFSQNGRSSRVTILTFLPPSRETVLPRNCLLPPVPANLFFTEAHLQPVYPLTCLPTIFFENFHENFNS